MWSIYGNTDYNRFLELSIESAILKSPDIQRIVIKDENCTFYSERCVTITRKFPIGKASKMAFRYESAADLLNDYDNVLHVDVDVIIMKDLREVFLSKKEGLSVASETSENTRHFKYLKPGDSRDKSTGIYWAGPLFSEEEKKVYEHIPSICMGVWLANKSDSVLLRKMSSDVYNFENRGFVGICLDQHAAVRRLLIEQKWNFSLQDHVSHLGARINDVNDILELTNSSASIVHFAGGVQPTLEKIVKMNAVYDFIKRNEYDKG